MSAAIEYCDREIAKCKDMIRTWPHEAPCLKRLIKGWQRTKQLLVKRQLRGESDDEPAANT